jgi:hypothetical protein
LAVKTIPLQAKKVKLLSENEDISLTEVEIMRELSQHPNIITMLGSFIDIDFGST